MYRINLKQWRNDREIPGKMIYEKERRQTKRSREKMPSALQTSANIFRCAQKIKVYQSAACKGRITLIFSLASMTRTTTRGTFCQNDGHSTERGGFRGWKAQSASRRREKMLECRLRRPGSLPRTGNRHETWWLGSTGTTRTLPPLSPA